MGWALSTSLGVQIRAAQSVTSQLNDVLGRAFGALSYVFTWRQPALSALIVVLLLGISVGNAFLFGIEQGDHFCKSRDPCYPELKKMLDVVRQVRGWLWLVLCVFVMVFQALWFSGVRSVLKICGRFLYIRRNAPSCWAFFRAES